MSTDGSPVRVLAMFHAKEGRQADVRELLTWMVEHTRREPGCDRYDLYAERDDDRTFVLLETYHGADALEAHRATEHYVEYRRRIADMLERPIDVTILEPIEAAS